MPPLDTLAFERRAAAPNNLRSSKNRSTAGGAKDILHAAADQRTLVGAARTDGLTAAARDRRRIGKAARENGERAATGYRGVDGRAQFCDLHASAEDRSAGSKTTAVQILGTDNNRIGGKAAGDVLSGSSANCRAADIAAS